MAAKLPVIAAAQHELAGEGLDPQRAHLLATLVRKLMEPLATKGGGSKGWLDPKTTAADLELLRTQPRVSQRPEPMEPAGKIRRTPAPLGVAGRLEVPRVTREKATRRLQMQDVEIVAEDVAFG